jgi:hypothetical protein
MFPNAVHEGDLALLRSLSLAFVAMMFVLMPTIVLAEEQRLFVPLTPSEHSWFERYSKPVLEKTEGVTAIQFAQLDSERLLDYVIEPGLRGQPIRPIAFNLLPRPLPTTIVTDRVERSNQNFYQWTGHIEGEPNSLVVLTVRVELDGPQAGVELLGLIIVKNRTFRIHRSQKGAYVLVEIDTSKFPPESPPRKAAKRIPHKSMHTADPSIPPRLAKDRASFSDIAEIIDPVTDSCVVDVAVAYTPEAQTEATEIGESIDYEIRSAIDVANVTLSNSGVRTRLRLVATSLVQYRDSGDLDTDLTYIQNAHPSQQFPSPTELIPVHTMRDDNHADLVALWVQSGTFGGAPSCGLSAQLEVLDELNPEVFADDFSESAFSIVPRRCALNQFSMAHEFGHLMGAHHDRTSEGAPPNTLYSYGLVHASEGSSFDPDQHWMTIMGENMALSPPACPVSYACCSCSNCGACTTCIPCIRQSGFWSNPDIRNQGTATGIEDVKAPTQSNGENSADNHRTLNASARTVARFRPPYPAFGACEGLDLTPPLPPAGFTIRDFKPPIPPVK